MVWSHEILFPCCCCGFKNLTKKIVTVSVIHLPESGVMTWVGHPTPMHARVYFTYPVLRLESTTQTGKQKLIVSALAYHPRLQTVRNAIDRAHLMASRTH